MQLRQWKLSSNNYSIEVSMASKKHQHKQKLSESQIRKRKVRASGGWAELRSQIRDEQKTDPISMRPLSRSFNLHHLSQDDRYYDDLSRERFVGLNEYSHRCVHYLYDIITREGDFDVLERIKQIIEEMQNITAADELREE